jgi:ubiquinone/menaquinone biosynthesis C-methylase UbiE
MVIMDRETVRGRLHGMWASVAPAWQTHAEYADARGAAITARMLELAAPGPGARVLELACGAGGVGLAAAGRVGPDGEVVLSDVVPEMTAIAGARANGLHNVRTRVLDLERVDEPDASYDVVLCREGLMFALDPEAAVREIARVLRPGGRVALAVWGPRLRNPWLHVLFETVSAHLGEPVPPPGIPGPFALDDPSRLGGLLAGAGLTEVVVEEVETPLRDPSFEQWWTRTAALAGPLAGRIAALPPSARAALEASLREAVRPFSTSAGLEFPGVSLLAGAHRPAPSVEAGS